MRRKLCRPMKTNDASSRTGEMICPRWVRTKERNEYHRTFPSPAFVRVMLEGFFTFASCGFEIDLTNARNRTECIRQRPKSAGLPCLFA